jgi:hypothetical protein
MNAVFGAHNSVEIKETQLSYESYMNTPQYEGQNEK